MSGGDRVLSVPVRVFVSVGDRMLSVLVRFFFFRVTVCFV